MQSLWCQPACPNDPSATSLGFESYMLTADSDGDVPQHTAHSSYSSASPGQPVPVFASSQEQSLALDTSVLYSSGSDVEDALFLSPFGATADSTSCFSSPHDLFSSPSPSSSPIVGIVPSMSAGSAHPMLPFSLDSGATEVPLLGAPVAVAIVQSKAAAAAAAAAAADEPPKKRRRKRKRSDIDSQPTAVTLSRAELLKMTTEDLDRYELEISRVRALTTEEQQDIKRQRRLIKNRESAQQSRMRKKLQSDIVDNTLTDLARENIRLTEQLAQKEQENLKLLEENMLLRAENKQLKSVANSSSFDWQSIFTIAPARQTLYDGTSSATNSQVGGVCLMILLFSVAVFFNVDTGLSRNFGVPPPASHIGKIVCAFGQQDRSPATFNKIGNRVTTPPSIAFPAPSARPRDAAPAASRHAHSDRPSMPRKLLQVQDTIQNTAASLNLSLQHSSLEEYSLLKIEGMTGTSAASEQATNQTSAHAPQEQAAPSDAYVAVPPHATSAILLSAADTTSALPQGSNTAFVADSGSPRSAEPATATPAWRRASDWGDSLDGTPPAERVYS